MSWLRGSVVNSVVTSIIIIDCYRQWTPLGNCQRPVFSLGVSQHMHKIQTCENLKSICRRSCEIIMEEKTPLSHEVVCFQMLDFKTSKPNSYKSVFSFRLRKRYPRLRKNNWSCKLQSQSRYSNPSWACLDHQHPWRDLTSPSIQHQSSAVLWEKSQPMVSSIYLCV